MIGDFKYQHCLSVPLAKSYSSMLGTVAHSSAISLRSRPIYICSDPLPERAECEANKKASLPCEGSPPSLGNLPTESIQSLMFPSEIGDGNGAHTTAWIGMHRRVRVLSSGERVMSQEERGGSGIRHLRGIAPAAASCQGRRWRGSEIEQTEESTYEVDPEFSHVEDRGGDEGGERRIPLITHHSITGPCPPF